MTLATLADVLQPALQGRYAVAGLVTLGWEDMRAFTLAAESLGAPVIPQAGPSCRAHTPLPVLGAMVAPPRRTGVGAGGRASRPRLNVRRMSAGAGQRLHLADV